MKILIVKKKQKTIEKNLYLNVKKSYQKSRIILNFKTSNFSECVKLKRHYNYKNHH